MSEDWWTGRVQCALCGHLWVAIWPDAANNKAFECSQCHGVAGMPDPPSDEDETPEAFRRLWEPLR